MNALHAAIVALSLGLSAQGTPNFKSILLQKVAAVDLCSGKTAKIPASGTIELWSAHCGNCIDKIKDSKPNELIFINVDQTANDRSEACRLIKRLGRTSLADTTEAIKKQLGEDFVIPVELTVRNSVIEKTKIGYWRKPAPSDEKNR